MKKPSDLAELLQFVRVHSPFYRELYKYVAKDCSLTDLPITEQQDFWTAYGQNRLLTSAPIEGIVFKSCGTTGNPKFSVFTSEEWLTFTTEFGRGMARGKSIEPGDRVANIFY